MQRIAAAPLGSFLGRKSCQKTPFDAPCPRRSKLKSIRCRFYLKMHVVVHQFVAYQADFELFAESVQRLNEPVFVVVVLKNIFLVDASHDDVVDAELGTLSLFSHRKPP